MPPALILALPPPPPSPEGSVQQLAQVRSQSYPKYRLLLALISADNDFAGATVALPARYPAPGVYASFNSTLKYSFPIPHHYLLAAGTSVPRTADKQFVAARSRIRHLYLPAVASSSGQSASLLQSLPTWRATNAFRIGMSTNLHQSLTLSTDFHPVIIALPSPYLIRSPPPPLPIILPSYHDGQCQAKWLLPISTW